MIIKEHLKDHLTPVDIKQQNINAKSINFASN